MEGLDQLEKLAEQAPDQETKLLIYLVGVMGGALVGMWYYTVRLNEKQSKEVKELHKDCEARLEKHNDKLEELIKDTSEIAAKCTVAIQEVINIKTRR